MRKRKKRYMKPAAFLLAAALLFGSITPVYGAEESPIVKTETVENTENTEKPDGNMEQSGGSMDEPDENVDEPGGEESGNPDKPDGNAGEPEGEESGNPAGPDGNVDEPEGEESGNLDGNAGQPGEPEDGETPSGDASGTGEGTVTGEEGGEGLPGGEENVPTPDGEKCICTEPCTEEAVNEECPVCGAEGADLSLCEGGMDEPEKGENILAEDGEECICTELCTEEAVNEECPVCGAEGADLSLCEGKAEEEEKCICTVACTEESRNEECPICGVEDADLTCCLGKKEETKQTRIEIEEVKLIETGGEGEEDRSAVIGSTGQAGFNIQVRLDGPESETVTLGYRFTIPKASASGGEWNYGTGTYQWLTSFDGSAPKIVEKDGNLIIEGKVEARSSQGNVVPGIYLSSITVTGKNLVNEEKANLTVECWVYEEGEESGTKSADAEISVESRPKYSLTDKVNGGAPTISGYFNKKTGEFYVSRPENGEDYVYGRVVMFRILAWNDSTSERPDPTKPISFDFSYGVQLNVNGELTDVTESDEQPVLMAVKRADEEVKGSQLETTPVQDDVTLGGLIEDNSNRTGPGNVGFYHGGDYTFQENEDGNVHVEAVLSKGDKNSGYRHAAIWGIIFVPLSQSDPEGSYRQLNIRAYALKASSYGGRPIEVTQEEILQWYKINPDISEGASIEGLFSRQIRVGATSAMKVVKREESVTVNATVNNVDPLNIADYDIRAINVLTKFDTNGYECNSNSWWDAPMRTGFVGEEAVLYAVKKDGKGWSNEYEMNHTEDDELLYYDDYQTPAKEGKKIVGILMELRGKWVSGSTLTKPSTLKVIGDGGKAYAIVQDVKIWRGQDVASWKGTNGRELKTLPDPDDKVFPYDNPSNEEGVYRKDTWPENEPLPIETEGHTWGDTLYECSCTVRKQATENKR